MKDTVIWTSYDCCSHPRIGSETFTDVEKFRTWKNSISPKLVYESKCDEDKPLPGSQPTNEKLFWIFFADSFDVLQSLRAGTVKSFLPALNFYLLLLCRLCRFQFQQQELFCFYLQILMAFPELSMTFSGQRSSLFGALTVDWERVSVGPEENPDIFSFTLFGKLQTLPINRLSNIKMGNLRSENFHTFSLPS